MAIFAMVQTHIWQFYIAKPQGFGCYIYNFFVHPLGGYAAPLFTLIAGMSACLAYQALVRRCSSKKSIFNQFALRGLFLFLLSTLVNFLNGPVLHILDISILNWGVIQLIGFCLFFVPIFLQLPFFFRLLFVFLPVIMADRVYPVYPVLPWLHEGFAPLFPWSSLFWGGVLVGEGYNRTVLTQNNRLTWIMLSESLLIFSASFILNFTYLPFSWAHEARLNATTILIFQGLFILLVLSLGYLLDRKGYRFSGMQAVIGLGKKGLTVYYLQLFGIVAPAFLVNLLVGYSPQIHWVWFFPLVFLTMLVLHLFVNFLWAKYDFFLTLEWSLTKIVKGLNKEGHKKERYKSKNDG